MSDYHILADLNPAQKEAVTAPLGNLLVLAGAGSGKTRVLVHRIAWLIQEYHLSPNEILAVTFTNKAAGEMRLRIEKLLGQSIHGMWVGTFHGLAHRFLRSHWQAAKLPETFQILDSDDQQRLLKRIIRNMELDEEKWPPKQAQWFINSKKDEGLRSQHIETFHSHFNHVMASIYQHYEAACEQSGMVDFAELLLRMHEVLRDDATLRAHYQHRFRCILVDEFQDTNAIQYAWLRVLAGANSNITIVGDDDQSIYGWRGAKIENIHRFSNDFPNTLTIRLEQNYRSTGNILTAANSLIENNDDRLGKQLWTDRGEGEPIFLYASFNEIDEARFIMERIRDATGNGFARRECAILYRSNAQSRVIEETLIHGQMPYRIYGGLRFFERTEIKDALAYLRLISNCHDDTSFERVINTPTRGIGHRTQMVIRECARDEQSSLWSAALKLITRQGLPTRAESALKDFIAIITKLSEHAKQVTLHELTEAMLEQSQLLTHYSKEKGEKAQSRVENLEELISATRQFEQEANSDTEPLTEFLTHAALEAGESQGDPFEDCVQLMTLHAAKGLEFPLVFLTGMEEGVFPSKASYQEPGRLEEERRLCYVGMTRAMQKLYITYAESRRLYGSEMMNRPSRFITEIPRELLQEVRLTAKVSRPVSRLSHPQSYSQKMHNDTGFKLGQHVCHQKFGEGVILGFEGQGSHARIQVKFHHAGTKWLVAQYAKLAAV